MGRKSGQIDEAFSRKPEALIRKIFRWVLIILVLVLIPQAYQGWQELYLRVLERGNPEIEGRDLPSGIGLQPVTLHFVVKDAGSGIDEIVVQSEQHREIKTLLRKTFPQQHVEEESVSVDILGKESGLREGPVTISVRAYDRSFWSNGKSETFSLNVDYKKPKIEVLSTQHNAVQGGSELVFYRVPEEKNLTSGLRVGEGWIYPGFPAKDLDPAFEARPEVYFSLFAIPLDFDEQRDRLMVFAKDPVGNIALASLYYRVRKVAPKKKNIVLEEEFLRTKVGDLAKHYRELTDLSGNDRPEGEASIERFKAEFSLVNVEYRKFTEQAIQPLFQRPKQQRYWYDRFLRLENAATQAQFGENRTYTFQGVEIGTSVHEGVDLASSRGVSIRAANRGVVIFAEDLAIYGNTVIIDHGFGLSTLYGHLSTIQTTEGAEVDKGAVIGLTGSTGFAGGDHLHFEIRIAGTPVNPIEWWDSHWIHDHIEQKVADIKKVVGIQTPMPLR